MGIYDKLSKLEKPKPGQPVKEKKKPAEILTKKKVSKKQRNIASNITILQFSDDEIEQLKDPAYMPHTFRLTKRNLEWIKDTAYRLSKEVKRGKVSQADILRISIKLFEDILATNKADLIKILEKIK